MKMSSFENINSMGVRLYFSLFIYLLLSFSACVSDEFSPPSENKNGFPAMNKIVVVIGENTNASSVIGSSDAPYINELARGGANLTESFAIEHPSQPNYLDLFSGSNQGMAGNN